MRIGAADGQMLWHAYLGDAVAAGVLQQVSRIVSFDAPMLCRLHPFEPFLATNDLLTPSLQVSDS